MGNLNLPKSNGLFITATDTEVGKTLVAGAMLGIVNIPLLRDAIPQRTMRYRSQLPLRNINELRL